MLSAPTAPTSPRQPSRPAELILTPTQVAERLGVSRATVWRLIRSERLAPVYRLGRRATRVPESALARYLASCES